ncbi:MAG: UDP-N-acetylmuramoyl-L-alanine--D-glutamate ligase [Ignavibacteria bacterium]|nr:UDP-N-acetylmuramoyl-L-alanine--D-glutamate ligase [Ignavibacteria bacterium]MCU7503155.1 UDP-N-acetylmuramoyl-L-alanine--D-glutamate ligase [Ignavibacteria bacterium]MCU7518033.1 UDP-N-acetylmuramoyl-L-alanine--D-glutamate ligase [Ignavibacteria bacterium]
MSIAGKKISIIGAVRSGLGAARLVKSLGGVPFVSDSAPKEKIQKNLELLDGENISYEFAGHSERVYDCEFMITSPGVPSDSQVLVNARAKGIKIISEVEFASNFCKGKIISITGTNGKTTTTSLCAHVLNECGLKTYLAGNIGIAFSDVVLNVKEDECVALETSSFQLDHVDTFKPSVATILNITPDHLDRYGHELQNYINSKLNVFKNQDENDFLILNADDERTPGEISNPNVKRLYFSLHKTVSDGACLEDGKMVYRRNGNVEFSCGINEFSLVGEHNYANAMAVIIIAKIFNLDNDKIKSALGNFPGVEHRLEFVRELDGVKYINDSKATNVDSVWYALRSFEEPIFLILGGKDKGNDYNQIRDLVIKKVKKIYAIGSSADKVFNFFHSLVKVEIKKSLEECVNTASSEARENDVVLLSPACASFDMFNDYEHRGRVFKEAVNKL